MPKYIKNPASNCKMMLEKPDIQTKKLNILKPWPPNVQSESTLKEQS